MEYVYPCIVIILFATLSGCGKTENSLTLQEYIESNDQWTPHDELIACALTNEGASEVQTLFYPRPFSTNFKVFRTEDLSGDPDDLTQFYETEETPRFIFNNYMGSYDSDINGPEHFVRVSYVSNDSLWYSKTITLKSNSEPTLEDDVINIDFSTSLNPIFTWEDNSTGDNIIYFHVIEDQRGDAIMGVYTENRMFQYYMLDNVVLNVTRPGLVPSLEIGQVYTYHLLGVDRENWVNLYLSRDFIVE